MAQIILTQMQDALRAVMAAGSEAFGDGMKETGDASRQIALMQSLAMLVGKMAEGIQQEDALAHWTRQLLQMLEDNASLAAADVPAMLQFYKAIAAMQALLGVPEDRRAWNPDLQQKADEDFPLSALQAAADNRLESAKVYAGQARSLVPAFIDAALRADLSEADGLSLKAIAEGLGTALQQAQEASAVNIYADYIESANGLLEALTRHMGRIHSASDVLWALVRGIDVSLGDAELDMELEAVQPGKPLPEGTCGFAGYALHLLAMLLPVAEQHAPDAVAPLRLADNILQTARTAQTCGEWTQITTQARDALGLAASEWVSVKEPDSYSLWGFYWGIEAALDKGDGWKDQDTKDKSRIGADYSGSLADLPGMPGKRADVALGCAIEIEQAASWLLAEVERKPYDHQRPFSRLLREIKRQAGLINAACDDDEVTLAELQERAT